MNAQENPCALINCNACCDNTLLVMAPDRFFAFSAGIPVQEVDPETLFTTLQFSGVSTSQQVIHTLTETPTLGPREVVFVSGKCPRNNVGCDAFGTFARPPVCDRLAFGGPGCTAARANKGLPPVF